MSHALRIANEMNIDAAGVEAAIALMEEGVPIGCIARYHRGQTGGFDEPALGRIQEKHRDLERFEARRDTVRDRIRAAGGLNNEVEEELAAAAMRIELEDVYLRFKPKPKSRAAKAVKRGLEPLAELIWSQGIVEGDHAMIAEPYVSEGLGVPDANAAWAGARDIVSERIAESPKVRRWLRGYMREHGVLQSRAAAGKESDGPRFREYFHFETPAKSVPAQRMLAMRRGAREGILVVRVCVEREKALVALREMLVLEGGGDLGEHMHLAIEDAYDRLLVQSVEKEARRLMRMEAEAAALDVCTRNLRRLLMSPTLPDKRVMGVDPGMRNGCRLAVVDENGLFLESGVVHPHPPKKETEQAAGRIAELVTAHGVSVIAVGNGTAGRDTETFLRKLAADGKLGDAKVMLVSEAGAGAYAASPVGEAELPELDRGTRKAVSLARRLQDPIAELVKVHPAELHTGQFQADLDQEAVTRSFSRVIEECVCAVGVDPNTAGPALIGCVPGIDDEAAKAIVAHREKNGPFADREALRNVDGLTGDAFSRAAGFLRIDGTNPLDATEVHPDHYELVAKMAGTAGTGVAGLIENAAARAKLDPNAFADDDVDAQLAAFVIEALGSAGRDPRTKLEPVNFDPEINEVKDLAEGAELEGVVASLSEFGAFVDVGVHKNGLVHISEMAHGFVKDPGTVVEVGQRVKVKVLGVDKKRGRISLSMKALLPKPEPRPKAPPRRGPEGGARPKSGPRPKGPGDPRRGKGGPPPQKGPRVFGESKAGRASADNPFAALVVKDGKIEWKNGKEPKKR